MSRYFIGLLGGAIVLVTLADAFEVVLLPRPVRGPFRLNRYFFQRTWMAWSRLARTLPQGPRREDFISVYGPLSMVLLFSLWAFCLILGFAGLHWALEFQPAAVPAISMGREIMASGEAFFTLDHGDIVLNGNTSRLLVIIEAGIGFGFVAMTVSYLPVLYQHFSTRDVQIIELAMRAGSPPSGVGLLRWHMPSGDLRGADQWLKAWERWANELIESHSTYPMLAFYRSQHDGYSWLASLAIILDACTIMISCIDDDRLLQAVSTFAAARRVLDEMCRSLEVRGLQQTNVRQPDQGLFTDMEHLLKSGTAELPDDPGPAELGSRLRRTYEPQLAGLSAYLLLPLPDWGHMPPADGRRFAKDQIVGRLIR